MAGLQAWIEEMQKKYGASSPQQDGPTLHAVQPFDQRYGVEAENDGMRYTGRGMDNVSQPDKPAGIVDEDEMVLESSMVDNLGGPKDARAGIEQLAEAKKAGVPSFQSGTANQTVGEVNRTSQDLNLPPPPKVKTADEVTKGMDRTTSQYEPITKKAITGLEDMAAGKSDAMESIGEVSRTSLAGKHATSESAKLQELAQTGAEGGTARAAMANERRRTGIETGNLESELAIEGQKRAERATEQLVNAGFRGEELDEAKHQSDVGIEMFGAEYEKQSKQWGADFLQRDAQIKETARQWGKDYALKDQMFNYDRNRDTIKDKLAAGDYDGANETLTEMGFDTIDYSTIIENENLAKVGQGMESLSGYAASNFDLENGSVQTTLDTMYDAQFADVPEADRPNKETWKQNTYGSMQDSLNPYHTLMESLPDEAMGDMFYGIYGDEMPIGDFEFNGKKGAEGFRSAVGSMYLTGGIDPETMGIDWDNKGVQAVFGRTDEEGGEGEGQIPEKFKNTPVRNAPAGTVTETEYGSAYKDKEGNVHELRFTDTEVSTNQDGFAFGADRPSFWNGTGWSDLSEGDTFNIKGTLPLGDKSTIPKGTYKLEGEEYVNVDTGEKYPAKTKKPEPTRVVEEPHIAEDVTDF